MADGLPGLVNTVAKAMPCTGNAAIQVNAGQVINDKKVSDHHAVIPTRNIGSEDLAALPIGERAVLELVALRLLCAVGQPYEYAETVVTLDCVGHAFTAKGRAVKKLGWKALEESYRAGLKDTPEPDTGNDAKALPMVFEGQIFTVRAPNIKEGKTTPPKHFTEDTLLSAMEVAGAKDMPDDAERKGLGTPATRAGVLEKLVSAGFVERKKFKKTVQLFSTHAAVSLITVLPEPLQSPLLTAEWEYRLKEIERGELKPDAFLGGITQTLKELVSTYHAIEGAEILFPSEREVVGKCPRCGGNVTESKQGFFCDNAACKFALWKNSKFFTAKKKQLTKAVVADLLTKGRVTLKGCYSEKTGKPYDATLILEDDGQRTSFQMEFPRKGGTT